MSKSVYRYFIYFVISILAFPLSGLPPIGAAPRAADAPAAPDAPLAVVPPTVLAPDGVRHYNLAVARVLYYTPSDCSVAPGRPASSIDDPSAPTAPGDPELIRRVFVTGSLPRTLFEADPVRPPDACNPYHVRSNLVGDNDYVYWADDTGLVRTSTAANAWDAPTPVSSQVKSAGNQNKVELAIDGSYVYAMTYDAGGKSHVWRINKTNFNIEPAATINGTASNLQARGGYVFWLINGTLQRGLWFLFALDVVNITSGVSSYYPEGGYVVSGSSYVYIAKNDQVMRYNHVTGQLSGVLYDSPSPDTPYVYSLVTDANNLYLLESREVEPCPGCLKVYNQVLLRLPKTGGAGAPLYEHTAPLPGYRDVLDLRTYAGFLFWQEGDKVVRLPNNADVLPQTNLSIERLEVTQGIQNTGNSVPLIKGRRTFVRLFPRSAAGTVDGVTAFLYRVNPVNQQPVGQPLAPINREEGTHITVYPTTNPGVLGQDFLYELPADWVDDSVLRLKAVLNPYNSPIESNTNDNSLVSPAFTMLPSPRLDVSFYVIGYDINNVTFYPRGLKDVDQTYSWIRRAYPVASDPSPYGTLDPGFHPDTIYLHMPALISRLNQTAEECQDFVPKERSLCAATYLLDLMEGWQEEDFDNDGHSNVYFALFHTQAGFGRGRGRWGLSTGPAGTSCCGSGAWDFDGAFSDWYSAHEMGHSLGRHHPVKAAATCEHSADDGDFPYDSAAIGTSSFWGFDFGDAYFGIPRQPLSSSIWRDVMSYCDNQWISDYTYFGIYGGINEWNADQRAARAATTKANDVLRLHGTLLAQQQTAVLPYLKRLPSGTLSTQVPGDYALRLFDTQGQLLAEHAFTPEADDQNPNLLSFGLTVPFPAGAGRLKIVRLSDSSVWADQVISANPPVVSNVQLVSSTLPVTGTATLTWDAQDPDGGALKYDVLASRDGGASFEPLALDLAGKTWQFDANLLGGGSTIFRVMASDGVQTGAANAPAVLIAYKAPHVAITNPSSGGVVEWGQLVNLTAEVSDPQAGSLPANQIVWSNQYGELDTGAMIDTTQLPVGQNVITVTASNNFGLSTSASITLTVTDDGELNGPTLKAGPLHVGWQLAAGDATPQTAQVSITNTGPGTITWTASTPASWLTLSAPGGAAPATLTLTANPAGLVDGAAQSTTVTITGVDGQGAPLPPVTITVGLSMGNRRIGDEPDVISSFNLYLPAVQR